MKYYLSIDQGTTSSRAIIFDSNLALISDSQKEYDLDYPSDGWVELNPDDVLKTVRDTLGDVLNGKHQIEACGITNQRETTIVWSKKTGKPIYPGIVWQDRRTNETCNQLKSEGHEEDIKARTGLVLDPYFSATKIKWILDNVEGARDSADKGELLFGTIDSFLIYNLTKEKHHLTDVTNASRTLLFNIKSMNWDDELLKLFDIPKSMMPKVLSCDGSFGTLSIDENNIPIRGVIGDQQAALVGQNCLKNGDMKSTYGTGCFLMVNTEDKIYKIDEGLLTTIAYKLEDKTHYAIEGSIYSCGNIVKWLRDKMKFFNNSEESEKFLNKNGNSNNVLFLPGFNGLGAPFWNSDVRGGFYGLTQDSSINDLVTAAFQAITFQTKEITSILENYDIKISKLLVDGGMVNNDKFCQALSDTLEKEIIKPANVESTAIGACKVAMIASGETTLSVKNESKLVFKPNIDFVDAYKQNYINWKKYLQKSITN
ncbi:MAG: glycerol kinase [Gammaproteobacteria bacterium]|nr:glycerol kinase [Gammaproteobacteria bacterium]|tara:strand:- start:897 stop:2348 length:1452 start_codon:yes stop_codon:yes gene_type:complete